MHIRPVFQQMEIDILTGFLVGIGLASIIYLYWFSRQDTSDLQQYLNDLHTIGRDVETAPNAQEMERHLYRLDIVIRDMENYLYQINHPNAEDFHNVCEILRIPDHPLELLANQWLYILRVLWKQDPEAVMLPWYELNTPGEIHEEYKNEPKKLYRPPHIRRR